MKELYGTGFFGQRLRQWSTSNWYRFIDNLPKLVVVRQAKKGGGGFCRYEVPYYDAYEVCLTAAYRTGDPIETFYIGEQLEGQPHNITFQGEYILQSNGPELLRFNTAKCFHREAMLGKYDDAGIQIIAPGSDVTGPTCQPILRQYLDRHSYQNLITLAESFPDHTIEFSCFELPNPTLQHNTIIWEVRYY